MYVCVCVSVCKRLALERKTCKMPQLPDRYHLHYQSSLEIKPMALEQVEPC